jgi:hypothetical protein
MNISALLDANMIGKFVYLPSLMKMDVTIDNVTVVNSGIPADMCSTSPAERKAGTR